MTASTIVKALAMAVIANLIAQALIERLPAVRELLGMR